MVLDQYTIQLHNDFSPFLWHFPLFQSLTKWGAYTAAASTSAASANTALIWAKRRGRCCHLMEEVGVGGRERKEFTHSLFFSSSRSSDSSSGILDCNSCNSLEPRLNYIVPLSGSRHLMERCHTVHPYQRFIQEVSGVCTSLSLNTV